MGTRIVIALLCGALILFLLKSDKIDWGQFVQKIQAGQSSAQPDAEPAAERVVSSNSRAETAPPPPAPLPPAAPSFPLTRTITDVQGRPLEGTVLGKRSGVLAFRRTADQKDFLIPLERLSSEDRAFFEKMADDSTAVEKAVADAKLAGRVAHWYSDMAVAQHESKKLGLPIYLLFTGPDWCPPCRSMEDEIFDTAEFKAFANRNLVLMKVLVNAHGRMSAPHKKLATEYDVSGYPTVVIISPDGAPIYNKTGGYTGLSSYLTLLKNEL